MPSLLEFPGFSTDCHILSNGHAGGIDASMAWTQLQVSVPSARRWEFMRFCYGVPGSAGTVGLPLPASYPYISGLFCDNASFEGVIPASEGCGHDTDRFTLHFRTLPYDETLRVVSIKYGGQVLTIPDGSFTFSDGSEVQGAGLFIPSADIVVKFYRQTYFDLSYFEGLTGKVNSTVFDIGAAPIGTILYEGAEIETEQTLFGFNTFTITHSFNYRRIPHNKLLNPSTGVFEVVTNAGSGTIYEEDDLNGLV